MSDKEGFQPDDAAHKHSPGLVGMRERVAAFAGQLEFESAPGAGTTVMVYIPVGANGA